MKSKRDRQFFDEPSSEFAEAFKSKVNSAKSIIISSHLSPDDDSISSVLSIYFYLINYLKKDKKSVRILYTGEKNSKWSYFENFNEIEFVDDIYGYVKKEDLVILVDGSAWKRFSRNEGIKKTEAYTICIDHHPTPEDKFDLHLVAKSATSTAEVIYRLFYAEDTDSHFGKEKLDKRICEILFLGLSGDTGNFRFLKPSDSRVFLIAERLLREGGFAVESLQSKYSGISEAVFNCLTTLMANSKIMEIANWPKFIISWLDLDSALKNDLKDNDIAEASSCFTPYLKGVDGVAWGFVVTPRLHDKSSSISLRSIPGSVNVRVMMERTELGGGHDRASGGKIRNKNPKEAIEIILGWMKNNPPVLS